MGKLDIGVGDDFPVDEPAPPSPEAQEAARATREDWERDPFKLIEEDGFFYGRGSADDKSMAAVFLDLMIRLKQERNFGYRMALDRLKEEGDAG